MDAAHDDESDGPISYESDGEVDTDEEFVCELNDGSMLPVRGSDDQMKEMRSLLNNGAMVSAQSTVVADRVSNMVRNPEGGVMVEDSIVLPLGPVSVIDRSDGDVASNNGRRLAPGDSSRWEGQKRILIVRVTDAEALVVSHAAETISDKFFGTSGDPVNVVTGFDGCSHGKFVVTNDYGGAIDESLLSAPGVLDVTVPLKLRKSTQWQLVPSYAKAAAQKLGLDDSDGDALPGIFDHVVFVPQRCYQVGTDCGWAAYGEIADSL